jgi:DNA-binding LacI/PurR family transcriptional regulator
MHDSSQITLKDVAKAVGVSAMTVSLALRNDPRIRSSRRIVIQDMARRMGYRPNPMATALVHQRWSVSPHPITAELAWINCWQDPNQLRAHREFDLYWRGANLAAEKCGFRLEEFVVGSNMSFARLEKILKYRNIHGILIPPHGNKAGRHPKVSSLDWSHFSVIRFGYSIPDFPAHVVAGNHMQSTILAFREIWKRGYERIGYVCHSNPSTRIRAGFLMSQSELPPAHRLALLELDVRRNDYPEVLDRWIRQQKPDAILTEMAEMSSLLHQLNYRVPADVSLAATSVLDGNADAGIYQNSQEIGKAAVETLISLISQNQTGIPDLCREVLVDARWQDGKTLPCRRFSDKVLECSTLHCPAKAVSA